MPLTIVNSEVVAAVSYAEGCGLLEVRLKNGQIRVYCNVTEKTLLEFLDADDTDYFYDDVLRHHSYIVIE